jgi:hypothetical protein
VKIRRIDFSPDEWLAGTVGLDAAELGVYWQACALIYSRGGEGITKGLLRRAIAGDARPVRRAIERLVDLGKLDWDGSFLTQKRCTIETQIARKRILNATENGRKGGRPLRNSNGLENPEVSNHQPSTIKEESPVGDSIGANKERANGRGAGRGSRLAVDWQPSAEDVGYAAAHGLDPGRIAEEFRDYWIAVAGARGVKLDWAATWRTWCRRTLDRGSPGVRRPGENRQGHSSIVAALDRVRLPTRGEGVH